MTIWGGDAVIDIGSDSAMKKRKYKSECYNTIYFLFFEGPGLRVPVQQLKSLSFFFFFFFFFGGGGGLC